MFLFVSFGTGAHVCAEIQKKPLKHNRLTSAMSGDMEQIHINNVNAHFLWRYFTDSVAVCLKTGTTYSISFISVATVQILPLPKAQHKSKHSPQPSVTNKNDCHNTR